MAVVSYFDSRMGTYCKRLSVACVLMNPTLSIEEQQWLLIIRARGLLAEIPSCVLATLAAKGFTREGEGVALTDLGAAEAEAIAAANFKLSLTPPPA
jgi:hypothetical protein